VSDQACLAVVVELRIPHPSGVGVSTWAIVRAAIDGAFQGRLLERTVDSGPYACDYAGAQQVKLRVPNTKPMIKPKDEVPKPPAGVLTATAYLKPGEVQDFADQIGDIGNVAVGYNLRIQVRIEVGSEGNRPPEDVVAKINEKLGEVSKEFGLRGESNILA
jgi:uncharacterized protein